MATAKVNGVQLFYEFTGSGDVPLILVHGSWDSHYDWDLVVPRLSESFRVLTYDRRGHSQSERVTGQGTLSEDVADLAALIEHLQLKPAWIAGNSMGASIAFRLACERPDLFRGLIAHEPPLFSLIADDPLGAPLVDQIMGQIKSVAQRIAAGDHAGAAEEFVDQVAIGPGVWATLPPEAQQLIIENAPTFLDESNDPDLINFKLDSIRSFTKPILLTAGDQSPPPFAPTVSKLAQALINAEVVTLEGAGHIPHVTHADVYVDRVIDFVRRHSA